MRQEKDRKRLSFISPRRQLIKVRSYYKNLWLKWVLPVVCIVIMVAIWVFPPTVSFGLNDEKHDISIQQIIKDNPHLENKATQVHYTAYDQNDRPFHVYALEAWQHDSLTLDLSQIRGHVFLQDGTRLNFEGKKGFYVGSEKEITLRGDVILTTSNGYQVKTEEFSYDLYHNKGISNVPVQGSLKDGALFSAKGFIIDNKGDMIHFIGSSKVVFNE